MSYLVLARKHRPGTFSEVVGQEHITQTLAGAIQSGRVAHAFCFTGPRGVGKTSVARILAKALNCEQGPTEKPCGVCPQCREIEEGRAVDVQEIDAASNSRVEDVRELRETIRYRPQAARYRVTILDEVHMLSKAAFNALLKTLEEPPEHAVFILATTDVHKVPLTILSRCQRYDFRRLAPKTLAAHLGAVMAQEDCALAPESLALMAREADGSIRDALSLLDQVLSAGRRDLSHAQVVELLGLVDRELVRAAAQAVLEGDAGRVLDLVAQVYAAGGEMQAFYGALQEHYRNLAAAKAAPAGVDLFGLTEEEIKDLREQAGPISAETLHEIFDQLARSEELFRRAGQPRLVMEMTLLKLCQVRPVLSLEDVIERLGRASASPGGGDEPAPAPRPAPPLVAPTARAATPVD
ncbi:MAG: DNA polymerase III subunit gamma/tau, partial [Pseudomonadota bacterium]